MLKEDRREFKEDWRKPSRARDGHSEPRQGQRRKIVLGKMKNCFKDLRFGIYDEGCENFYNWLSQI